MSYKFEFPDPVDFPEFGEYDGTFPLEGAHILKEMQGRVDRARQGYDRYPNRGMPIHARRANTDGLKAQFSEVIERVKNKEPAGDIKSVDRSEVITAEWAKNAIRVFLYNCGLWDTLKAYANVDVSSVAVQYSTPNDKHHYQQFRDCKTATKLLNLHLDPKPGVVKSIIYLDIEDGPFQAIPESYEWEWDEEERIYAWGNSVGNYLHTPLHRQVVASLPKEKRKNAIVGRLIPDGSELSDFLLSKLVSYTDDNVMLFDPCFTLHRGGLCQSGTRTNLQVVFR